MTEEPPIIDFLAELFRSSQACADNETRLLKLIEGSRDESFPVIASCNAITVLNQARVYFTGKDLHDLRIPGADLSGALCDNTNFADADLTNVNLTGAWLLSTNFNHALMAGVQFLATASIDYTLRLWYSLNVGTPQSVTAQVTSSITSLSFHAIAQGFY